MGLRTPTRLLTALCITLGLAGCSDREVDLAYLAPNTGSTGGAEVPPNIAGIDTMEIARVVDERPVGAASLGEGTSGGGTWEDAVDDSGWIAVKDAATLIEAVGGDTPRVVLIHPGDYDLGEAQPYAVEVCELSCPEGSSRASELQSAGKCEDSADVTTTESRKRQLRVGSNKTILGLGEGATLRNVTLDLSGSSNVILRNLEITDVNPGLVGIGDAITMSPSRYVWVDHSSFSNSSHTFINIHSSWDQESPTFALIEVASHITLSYNEFVGTSVDNCDGQQHWGVGTQRDPALTVHHNVVRGGYRGYPYLFGAETWGHVYNNFISGVTTYGVGVVCGAQGLIEANVFESNELALHVGDDGTPTWPFCAEGLFGAAWFPTGDASDDASNLLDDASGIEASDQPIDGTALDIPERTGEQRRVNVPVTAGVESYTYTLDAVSSEWAQELAREAGVGRIF